MAKVYTSYERVYLSMPISGYDITERDEFAQEMVVVLKGAFPNAEIINPMELSKELKAQMGREPSYKEYLENDYKAIDTCDAIVFAKDWDSSKGCICEKMRALKNKLKLFYLDYNDEVEDAYVRWKPVEPLKTCWELFGVECGEGWKDLYTPIIDEVNAYNEGKPENEKIVINQIKEKFGGLRVYLSKYTEKLEKMIDEAEDKSFQTCEYCGKPGKTRGKGWIYTLCDDCWDKKNKKS